MPRKEGAFELIYPAKYALEDLGWFIDWVREKERDNVIEISKDGKKEKCLIQTRSHDAAGRYLVGIIVKKLKIVDSLVLFFENEETMYKIPSDFLCEILDEMINSYEARFTGDNDEQWRVDFYVRDDVFSPQGTNGERIDILQYAISIPK